MSSRAEMSGTSVGHCMLVAAGLLDCLGSVQRDSAQFGVESSFCYPTSTSGISYIITRRKHPEEESSTKTARRRAPTGVS